MPAQEYKVVPAPTRPDRAMRRQDAEARHAATLTRLMNDMGAEGWEFVRAEALPAEERRGLFSRAVVTHHVLIFRREAVAAAPAGPAHAPGSPEDFAARASASLRNTSATRRFGGNAPPVGPARPDPRDLAAE